MRELAAGGGAVSQPTPSDHVLTDAEVIANADRAYIDSRAIVDLQVKTAESLDTKAGALLTVVVAVAAIVGPRVHLDSPERQWAGLATFVLALAESLFVLGALWPRDFAYGANAANLAASLEGFKPASVALARAEALRDAWMQNDRALDSKHDWYSRGLAFMPLLLIAIAFMVLTGAIRFDPGT